MRRKFVESGSLKFSRWRIHRGETFGSKRDEDSLHRPVDDIEYLTQCIEEEVDHRIDTLFEKKRLGEWPTVLAVEEDSPVENRSIERFVYLRCLLNRYKFRGWSDRIDWSTGNHRSSSEHCWAMDPLGTTKPTDAVEILVQNEMSEFSREESIDSLPWALQRISTVPPRRMADGGVRSFTLIFGVFFVFSCRFVGFSDTRTDVFVNSRIILSSL